MDNFESKRVSALDILNERKQGKDVVDRIILVSRLTHYLEDRKLLGNYFLKIFKTVGVVEDDEITGLLLIFPKHSIHVLECKKQVCVGIVNELHMIQKNDKPFLSSTKVLLTASDLPGRIFPTWSFRSVTSTSSGENLDIDMVLDLSTQVVQNIVKIGAYLGKQKKVELKTILDGLQEKMPENVPSQEELDLFLRSPLFFNLDQFIQHYFAPIDVVLDRELVWPIPVRLFPYD